MKKFYITALIFILSFVTLAQNKVSHYVEDALITKPAINSHCERLIKQYNHYIEAQQKLYAQRLLAKKLHKKNLYHSQEIFVRLQKIDNMLKKENEHIKNNLLSIEQNLIRFGCPKMTM
jgi:hypothetical protein